MENLVSCDSFLEVISNDVLDNLIYYNRLMVNYFYHNRVQSSVIRVEDSKDITSDVRSCFEGFCLSFGNSFHSVDKYIVFVNPELDVIEDCRKQVSENLPAGKNPTHVCILSNDCDVVEKSYETLLKVYPDLKLVQRTVYYNFSTSSLQKAKSLINDESKILLLNDYCEKLNNKYSDSSIEFIKLFTSCIDEIMSKCEGKFLVFGGDYQSRNYAMYKLILTELYVRKANCKFYVEKDDSQDFLKEFSRYVFDPDCMLVEDVVRYLMNLPDLVCELKYSLSTYSLVAKKDLNLKCMYVPLGDRTKSNVVTKMLNVRDLRIMPFGKYYDMRTDDFYANIRTEIDCRNFLHSLYDVFEVPHDVFLSVVNVFFFMMDGNEYVGVCLDYNFNATCLSNMAGMGPCTVNMDLERVKKLVYIDYCLNAAPIAKTYQRFLTNKQLTLNSISPLRLFSENSVLYRDYYVNNEYYFNEMSEDKVWADMPNSVFDCGMYSPMSVKFRTGFAIPFINKLGLDNTRKMLDSFGGLNLVTNPSIDLTTKSGII